MAEARKLKYAHETVELIYGKYPQARELADRFERLATTPVFIRELAGERAFREGLDPIPNRDAYEDFLRRVGHDFAAATVLPRGNFIRGLLPGAMYENYLALHGLVAARLMDRPGPLSQKQIVALYDTIDRILHGGAAWPGVTHVPVATAEHYQRLRRTQARQPRADALEDHQGGQHC